MFKDFYLNVELTSENAKMPTRAHDEDAGMDVYTPIDFTIPANGDFCVPLDIKVEFPIGYAMLVEEKSGVATKKKLSIGACIDKETVILTNKGEFTVNELTNSFMMQNNILIKSHNVDSGIKEYVKFDGFRVSNVCNTLKIYFSDGSSLICSEDHKLLTNKGWILAKDLDDTLEIIT